MEQSLVRLRIEIFENDAAIPKYTNGSGDTITGFVTLKVSDVEEILYIAGLNKDRKCLKDGTRRRTVELTVLLDHYLNKALGFEDRSLP